MRSFKVGGFNDCGSCHGNKLGENIKSYALIVAFDKHIYYLC